MIRIHELAAKAVEVTVRDNELGWRQWQVQLPYPTQSPLEIATAGFDLFRTRYYWERPIRALTIRGINPRSEHDPIQVDLFNDYQRRIKQKKLDDAVDEIRNRFGVNSIMSAALMGNLAMANDKCETVIMPNPMYSSCSVVVLLILKTCSEQLLQFFGASADLRICDFTWL